jgi:hypothetical protein
MRKAGRLSLSIEYYHNISFATAAGGYVLAHFSGGLKSVRKAQSPNSLGRLSLYVCQPDPQGSVKKGINQERGSPRLEKKNTGGRVGNCSGYEVSASEADGIS